MLLKVRSKLESYGSVEEWQKDLAMDIYTLDCVKRNLFNYVLRHSWKAGLYLQ